MNVSSKQEKSRRWFLLGGLISSLTAFAGMVFYPIIRFIMPPPVPESDQNSVFAAKVNELKPNSGKTFAFGSKPGLLLRLANGKYRAFTAVCPHLQCTVQYREDMQQIWCACHNAKFDLNGKVASGPPPAPLEVFDVFVGKEDIIVSKQG
jgi:cytochrome b6-f complex iron-sulfur subunit